jgi:hypothetical protein
MPSSGLGERDIPQKKDARESSRKLLRKVEVREARDQLMWQCFTTALGVFAAQSPSQ